ncbi:hypothetical protein [Bradyrhizobium roseum]|uniref:hypothetical protein n=1 Tax=Bradyrhizobium roseum TaxID=3056648 RepID=UPI0026322085|nr:hypothetical protein [Bradyrhizobium roseus]WKA30526.1 hypothetical protein QUH67_10330 [Bradyrhizobium roseus]
MPSRTERPSLQPRAVMISVAVLLAAGFGLTLLIFYPGVMTYDAKFVYEDIAKGTMGDWQSPVMVWLWGVIDPIAPGPGSMFLLIATTYWAGFGMLSLALASRGKTVALLLPLLAMTPPALAFAGIIWRDVLLATCWLLAATVAFAVSERQSPIRPAGQGLALVLLISGVLLRPNALLAAPILAAYIVWLSRVSLRRTAILYVPAMIGLFGTVQLAYYGMLDAKRQHPLQTIMIFDLGGISHFAKQNQFPVAWSESESAMLLNGCYQPTMWDIYWRLKPCDFVMRKVERETGLFGTPAIPSAWLTAVLHHPVAYLQHRSAFMWNFLAADNLGMWTADVEHPMERVYADRAAFNALVAAHDAIKPTPFLRAGFWLLACIVICGWSWRRSGPREASFALAVCGSATVYVASFYALGVASDFRYGYWAVLAAIAGGIVASSGEARTNEPEG